jgi:hemerythrin-like metal-binding protein
MAIGWQPGMATGAPRLDSERRALVEHAAALLTALEANGDRPTIERALRDLGDYSVRHFSQEEDCHQRGICPALEWTGKARAELITIIGGFRRSYESGGASPKLAEDLTCELSEWVSRYIPGPAASNLPCVTRSGPR